MALKVRDEYERVHQELAQRAVLAMDVMASDSVAGQMALSEVAEEADDVSLLLAYAIDIARDAPAGPRP